MDHIVYDHVLYHIVYDIWIMWWCWSIYQHHHMIDAVIYVDHIIWRFKGTIPSCSKLFFIRSCMSKDSAGSTGHVHHFFFQKILCYLQVINDLIFINVAFVTSFEDCHYILLFRYFYGAQLIQWFCYSKHLHVNCCSYQGSMWSIANIIIS